MWVWASVILSARPRLISGLLHFTGPSGVNSHLLVVGPGTKIKGSLCPSWFHEVTREEQ